MRTIKRTVIIMHPDDAVEVAFTGRNTHDQIAMKDTRALLTFLDSQHDNPTFPEVELIGPMGVILGENDLGVEDTITCKGLTAMLED